MQAAEVGGGGTNTIVTMDGGDRGLCVFGEPERGTDHTRTAFLPRTTHQDPYFYLFTMRSVVETFVRNRRSHIDEADRPIFIIEHFESGEEVAVLAPWNNLPLEIGSLNAWSWEELDMNDRDHSDIVISLWLLLTNPVCYECVWEAEVMEEYDPYTPMVWRVEVDDSCILEGVDSLMKRLSA